MAKNSSAQALAAAKALVAYIEFFRSHGTGETQARYPDDEPMGGYENIVRRAMECAAAIEGFARGWGAHDRPARVRAAAPDLLVAAKDVLRCAALPPEWAQPVRDAIAKAEGRKQRSAA